MESNNAVKRCSTHTFTFIFTHGPIVGHGEEGTHQDTDGDHDIPFVQWVNGEDMTVGAVFVRHTHMNIGLGQSPAYKLTSDNMNDPKTFNSLSATIPFSWYTIYIETITATKLYGCVNV